VTGESAFREILRTYRAAFGRIARVYAQDHDEEEDLYQEILLQIWRSLPSFRGDSAIGTWVYRVALNTGLSHRRRHQRRGKLEVPLTGEEPHPATTGSPRDESALLADFLRALEGVDRSVMLLYLEGLPHGDIAAVTGSTPGAIGVRLHRLRRHFEQRYLER
jgi:RNA polymerase sigma-70 factor (ECF subfamily)